MSVKCQAGMARKTLEICRKEWTTDGIASPSTSNCDAVRHAASHGLGQRWWTCPSASGQSTVAFRLAFLTSATKRQLLLECLQGARQIWLWLTGSRHYCTGSRSAPPLRHCVHDPFHRGRPLSTQSARFTRYDHAEDRIATHFVSRGGNFKLRAKITTLDSRTF